MLGMSRRGNKGVALAHLLISFVQIHFEIGENKRDPGRDGAVGSSAYPSVEFERQQTEL